MPSHALTRDLNIGAAQISDHTQVSMTKLRTHTDPTELVFTLLTSHMAEYKGMSNQGCCQTYKRYSLATSVLLDRALALAALLRVALNPIGGFRVVPALLRPEFRDATD